MQYRSMVWNVMCNSSHGGASDTSWPELSRVRCPPPLAVRVHVHTSVP